MNYKKELDSASVGLVVWEIASAIVTFLAASGCARMRLASLFFCLSIGNFMLIRSLLWLLMRN